MRASLGPVLATLGAVALTGCGTLVGFGPGKTLSDDDDPGAAGAGGMAGAGGLGGEGGDGGTDPDACPGTDVLWLKTYGDFGIDVLHAMAPDGNGGIYVTGSFTESVDLGTGPLESYGQADVYLARLDNDGVPLWVERYGSLGNDQPAPILSPHPDGVILVGVADTAIDLGSGPHEPNGDDAYVALVDADGHAVWERWFDDSGPQLGWFYAAVDPETEDVTAAIRYEGVISAGNQSFTAVGQSDTLLVRLDGANGNVISAHSIGSAGQDWSHRLIGLPEGRVFVAGVTDGAIDLGAGPLEHDGPDAFAALYEADWSLVWAHVFAFSGNQAFEDATLTQDGALLVVGEMGTGAGLDLGAGLISDPMGHKGGFVARLDPTTGLATESAALPGYDAPELVIEAPGGDVVIVGGFTDYMTLGGESFAPPNPGPQADGVAIKLSADFDEVAWKQLGATSGTWEVFTGVVADGSGNIFVGGRFYDTLAVEGCEARPTKGSADAFIMKRKL